LSSAKLVSARNPWLNAGWKQCTGFRCFKQLMKSKNSQARFWRRVFLPATADRDATHIALASAYEMDILLTWNYRHIANATIEQRLRNLATAAGFTLPVICTPEELMENDNEQSD